MPSQWSIIPSDPTAPPSVELTMSTDCKLTLSATLIQLQLSACALTSSKVKQKTTAKRKKTNFLKKNFPTVHHKGLTVKITYKRASVQTRAFFPPGKVLATHKQ